MHEAARLSDRSWGYFMAMKTRGARIELNSAGGEVGAEGAQFRAVEGELDALRAGFELDEQGGEKQHEDCRGQYKRLRREDAVGHWQVRFAKMPNTEDWRPNNHQGNDERCASSKNRATSYADPKKKREDERLGQGRCPSPLWEGYQESA
jgi:hypothetical protein